MQEKTRPRILHAGDSAVTVEFGSSISLEINGRVQQFRRLLAERALPGVRELVPAYRSLTVYFDPSEVDGGRFMAALEHLSDSTEETAEPGGRVVVVPVCYDGTFGPDMANVAAQNGLSEEEVVRLHTEPDYYCYMLGFTPGFPYLGGMNARIATPRLENPRTLIPAGSVGIAGSQTGIYPVDSPGGWQIIGRTPLVLFDPFREPSTLLDAGLRVRFEAVSEEEYQKIAEAVARGTWVPQVLERKGE